MHPDSAGTQPQHTRLPHRVAPQQPQQRRLRGDPAYRRRFRCACVHSASADPTAAHNYILVVEHNRLPWRNRPLRLVECNDSSVALHPNLRIRWLMAMANLDLHANGSIERFKRDPIHTMRVQCSRAQIIIASNNHLPLVAAQLDHVERRSSRYAKPLALTNSKVVDARVMTDH